MIIVPTAMAHYNKLKPYNTDYGEDRTEASMKVCTFIGHRESYAICAFQKVADALNDILSTDTSFIFYTGGMGAFDHLCESAVRLAKRQHPNLQIKLILVLPYLTKRLNENKDYYESSYDDILVPAELMGVHYKQAISMRNRWMVNQSDYLLAYVQRDFGGAYTTLQYAKRQIDLNILDLGGV